MKDIWKIDTWLVASTNRTSPPIQICGLRITFTDGVIAVENNNNSPLVLLISYYDNEGNERPFLRDNISATIIRQKGIEIGLEGDDLQNFVDDIINKIIVDAIGGSTKEERYATIAFLGQMYGQTLLPFDQQNGFI